MAAAKQEFPRKQGKDAATSRSEESAKTFAILLKLGPVGESLLAAWELQTDAF